MSKIMLFDLDGTISDSKTGIINAAKYALTQMGEEIPGDQVLQKFLGPPLWESFEKFLGFSKEKAEEAVRLYRVYYREKGLFENEVYEGVPQLLKTLKDRGDTLAVATSKPEQFSVRILEHFGLAHYFDTIAGASLDGGLREKSDIIACALQRLGAGDYLPAIMVGDRAHDIEGARKNGLDCIAVLYGYGSREEFEEHGAAYIVERPEDIAKI